MSIEPVMPSNHLSFCHPLLLLPSVFPSIRVFSSELAFCIRWPKYWSFSLSISPFKQYLGWISLGLIDLISLLSRGHSRLFSSTTIQKHRFFGAQPSLWSNSHTVHGVLRGWQRMKWLDGITNPIDIVWASSGSSWWTGKPGMLQSMGSQRVGHDWATELICTLTYVH